ncbi:MAG: metal-dependent hydrolase [Candidatus Dojkabacteria bacterium]|jgi:hypothetical protein|nr:metal-dependent hydrolase [Candidatus Dojkabacteria bacterium]
MFIAHGPLSYILNEGIQKKKILKLTKGEQLAIALLSFFFGILPDFDIFVLSMTETPPFQHHHVFTHSILFWILAWVLLRLGLILLKRVANTNLKNILNRNFVNILQYSFLIGVMSHLFADILLSYSRVLFPLNLEVTLLGGVLSRNYFRGYLFTTGAALELLILTLFVLLIYRKYLSKSIYIKYAIYTLFVISTFFLFFNTYMGLKTYNMAIYREEGKIIYDADFDTLIDYKDSDTDNSGRNNIMDAKRKELVESAYEILDGEYMVSSKGSIWRDIKYKYGAMTSYRLISQVYFNQNRAIEPVLRQFSQKRNDVKGYSIKDSYEDILYQYLNEKNLLRGLNKKNQQGKIFFVLDKDEKKVLNLGLTLENQEVGIVLEGEKKTKVHTLEEISKIYPQSVIKVQR